MNARLADGTTTGDLVLQQAKIVPQTQHFFDFSHGQSLLGHSVSPLARGEIPHWLSSTAFRSYSESSIQKRQYQLRFRPPLSSRFGLFTSPESLFTCPESRIHILPESLFTSPRNQHSHAPEYATGISGRRNADCVWNLFSMRHRLVGQLIFAVDSLATF